MSNLLKFNSVMLQGNEARVIDSNERLGKKLEQLRESELAAIQEEEQQEYEEAGFTEGLDVSQMAALLGDSGAEGIESSEDGRGHPAHANIIKAEPISQGPTKEEMLAEVQEEIAAMLEQAANEAADIKENAYQMGYQSGLQTGQQEMTVQAERQAQELQDKKQQLEAYYQNKLNEVEPMFIDVLTEVYAHVFHVELDRFKEAIALIVDDIISGSEGNRDFIVRVSETDYPLLSERREQLMSHTVGNATLEIIIDKTLAVGDCLLETGGGIFDCGIDTQLKELSKELKLLSYKQKA